MMIVFGHWLEARVEAKGGERGYRGSFLEMFDCRLTWNISSKNYTVNWDPGEEL